MSASPTFNLTLIQTDSVPELERNLAAVDAGLAAATEADADLVVLPENVLCRGSQQQSRDLARPEHALIDQLAPYSQRHGVAVIWGGVPCIEDDVIYNTMLAFSADGTLLARYRKIHLFQLVGTDTPLDETALFAAGKTPVVITINDWSIGLSICYDLRFPELYRSYAGVDMMLCPAEFTYTTGRVHWETLVRARAIENQCFVAAVDQCGTNRVRGYRAYGHSMVIGPWGQTIASSDEDPTVIHTQLERQLIDDARSKVPALQSIRHRVQWSS